MRFFIVLALAALAAAQDAATQTTGEAAAIAPVFPPVGTTSATSTSAVPDVAAIFSACAADVVTLCSDFNPETCVNNLRLNFNLISQTCRDTMVRELPCIQDAATHCGDSSTNSELATCLLSLRPSDLSERCVNWLQAARDAWAGENGNPATALPNPPLFHRPHHGHHHHHHGEEDDDNEDDEGNNNMDEDEEDSQSGGGHRHKKWKHRKPHGFFFLLIIVSLFSAAIGSCCTLCCVRRRMRRCQMRGGAAPSPRQCRRFFLWRRADANAAPPASSIPMNQLPPQGGVGYAVMSDDIAAAVPV